ncbi:MAG: Smr/MutS family protein [Deltaproteobacteria bacterium]|jgi:DNA-nicking Smr family endonuclease|nr:Smr/MutS family protein [Deltaproteobacteria bacterium]
MARSEKDQLNNPFLALADLKSKLLAQARAKAERERQGQREALKAKKAEPKTPTEVSLEPVDDTRLFFQEMADVKPLKKPAKRLTPEPPDPKFFKLPELPDEDAQVLESLTDLISGRAEFDLTYSDEYVEGSRKGLPDQIVNKLRQGQVPFQDYLDLHGLTLSQAEAAIVDFVLRSVSLRRRCLLLVHGRGRRSTNGVPVLKHNLEHLLLRWPIKKHIQAFTSARPIDGGTGACYILLRH